MGIIQKQSISGMIWSYVGVGLGFVTTAVLFTRMLETDEIGLLRLLVSYSSIMAMLASLGINTVIIKMFPRFRDEQKKHRGFFGLSLLVALAGFFIVSLIYVLFSDAITNRAGDDSQMFVDFFYAVIPLTLFGVFFGVFDSYMRVLFSSVEGIAYKEVYQRVIIIAVVLLYFFGFLGFSAFVWVYVFAHASPVLFFIIKLKQQKKLFLKPDFRYYDPPVRREIFSVALFGIMGSLSNVLVQSIDVIMVDHYLGLSPAGVYTISFFFGTLILIPLRTMAKIGSVVISEAWQRNDLKTISEVYTKSSLTLTIAGMLFFIGIWGNIENVFHLIGEEFISGRFVVFFIALANLMEVAMGLGAHIIVNSRYYRWYTYLLIVFALLIILTNILLIPVYGIVGAALASFISKFLFNLMKFLFIRIRFGIHPFSVKHLLVVAVALLAWFATTFLPVLSNYVVDIFYRSAAITILFLAPIYFFRVSPELNERIATVLRYMGFPIK